MNRTGLTRSVAVAGIVLCGIGAAQPAVAAASEERGAGHGDPAALTDPAAIAPHEAAYGTFAEAYRQNTSDFMTPDTNPAIGVLGSMLDYFTPGETWNDGTVLNQELHEQNIGTIERLTQNRTDEEAREAYIYDRRNQNYSMSEGLEENTDAFRELVNAGTTIPDEVPAEALTQPFDDEGNENGAWADEDSALGGVVELVNTVRGEWATSNRAKEFYQYMRPFRWSDEVVLVPELEAVKKPEESAESDGGFPSGHTNAAFLAGYALANAIPEHADDLMSQAAAVGHGRHALGSRCHRRPHPRHGDRGRHALGRRERGADRAGIGRGRAGARRRARSHGRPGRLPGAARTVPRGHHVRSGSRGRGRRARARARRGGVAHREPLPLSG
jgi:hypothetical protein